MQAKKAEAAEKQQKAGVDPTQQVAKLKKKIKKLVRQRNEKIEQHKKQIIRKYIPLNRKVQEIVEGVNRVQRYYTNIDGKIIIQHEKKQQQKTQPSINDSGSIRNEGIPDYWKKVLLAQYSESVRSTDLQLLSNLKAIQIQDYSSRRIAIDFTFRPSHMFIPQGTYTRTICRNEVGQPTLYEGNRVWTDSLMQMGLMKIILTSRTDDQNQLQFLNQFFELLASEIVPRSLQYYSKYRLKQLGHGTPNSDHFEYFINSKDEGEPQNN